MQNVDQALGVGVGVGAAVAGVEDRGGRLGRGRRRREEEAGPGDDPDRLARVVDDDQLEDLVQAQQRQSVGRVVELSAADADGGHGHGADGQIGQGLAGGDEPEQVAVAHHPHQPVAGDDQHTRGGLVQERGRD